MPGGHLYVVLWARYILSYNIILSHPNPLSTDLVYGSPWLSHRAERPSRNLAVERVIHYVV